jgi:hypothetical protein
LSIRGDSGWRFVDRSLRDISIGGISFSVNFWEKGTVGVGEGVRIDLELGETAVSVRGRCVHMSGRVEWWAQSHVGVAFDFDGAYGRASAVLIDYLLRLQRELCPRQPRGEGAAR